jgi:hypothetical protein
MPVQDAASTESVVTDTEGDILDEGISDPEEIAKPTWMTSGESATTSSPVVIGETYTYPINPAVTVTFSKLPAVSSTLTIKTIYLTDEQVKATNAASDVAYDITTDMTDGSFEYDLTLPKVGDNTKVIYAENVSGLVDAKDIKNVVGNGSLLTISNLDHFTIFVVTFEGSVGVIEDSSSTAGNWYLRYVGSTAPSIYSHAYQWGNPAYVCDPNNTATIFTGTIDVNSMPIGAVSMVGLLDKGLLETGKTGYQSGAYAYIFRRTSTLVRIGPSDGNQGGEIVSNFRDYTIPVDGILDLTMAISSGTISLSVEGDTAISDIYGVKKGTSAYTWGEFAYGAIPGWDNYNAVNMPYTFNVTGCLEIDRSVDIPTHISPENNSFKTTASQTLIDWTTVTDPSSPVSYIYQSSLSPSLNPDGSFVSPVYTSSPLSDSQISTTGTPEGEYYWHVKAIDGIGNESSWTDAWKITVDNTVPAIPQNLRFSNPVFSCGAVTNVGVNTVDWNDSTDNFALAGYDYSINYPLPTGGQGTWNSFFANSQYTGTLNEGLHQIKVRAKDKAGNVSDWTSLCEITYDKTGPEAPIIVSPTPEQYFNVNTILNDWTDVSDPSGIQLYRIEYKYDDGHTFSGAPYRTTTASQRNHTPSISEQGGVSFRVQAFDNAGNEGVWSEWVHYYYDQTAPATPVLVSPSDGVYVNGASVTNVWSDTSTDVAYYNYESYNDSNLTSLRWSQTFTTTSKTAVNVADATFWWRVQAVDNAGNKSAWTDAWKITVDNIAPVSLFGNNLSNSNNGSAINILGTSTDANNVSSVSLYFRNSDLSSDWTYIDSIDNTSSSLPFDWGYEWTPPYEGTFDIKAEGIDTAGNMEHSPMMTNITYDTTLPTIGNVNIVVDYLSKYVNGQTGFLITVPVSDSLSGIDHTSCMYTLNGTTWSNGTLVGNRCTFGVPSNQLFDNAGLEISAKVKDNAGNTVVSNIVERKVDKNLPQSQTIIDNPFYGPNSLPLVKGVASDTVSEITNVMVTLKRSSNNRYWLIGNTWTVIPMLHNVSGNENWTLTKTLPALQNGVTYTFTPYAWDQVHALPGTGIADSFIWDNQLPQDPTSFVASHSLNTPKNDNTIDITFSGASDAISGVAGYYYSFSNTPETPIISPSNWLPVGTTNVTSPVLSDGIWYFNIRTLDNAGNITSTTHYGSLIVDTTAPDVEITSPTSTHLSATIEVRGTVTDTNPHHYWFVITNSSGTKVAGPGTVNDTTSFTDKLLLNWNTTSLPDGQYTIKLEARDAANNKDAGSVEWLTVNVDNTAPTVDLIFDIPSPSATGFKAVFSEPMNEADATNPTNYFLNNWPTAGGTGDLLGDASITYDSETNTATVTFLNAGWYLSPEQQWGVQNVHDLAGNIMSVTPYTEYTTPMLAPVTTASGIDSQWHNTDVTVTLTCTDIDGSGCYLTHYSVNGGTEQIGNTVTVSEEGLNTITFYSEDMAGNVEAVQTSEVVKIDKTNPLAQVLAATTFTTGDTTPRSLALSDNTELSQVCYVIDTNTQTCLPLFGTGYSWDITALINTLSVGTHIFTYYVVDTAGNRSDSNTIVEGNDPYASSVIVAAVPQQAVRGAATVAEVTPEAVQGVETTEEEEETSSPVNQEEVKGTQDTNNEEADGKPIPWWVYVIGGVSLLSFIIFLIARRRKEEEDKEKNIK